MTSGKKLDRETVNYLRALPEIVRRVQGGRIYYTNSFRAQATARMPWETGPSTSSATTG